MSKAFIIPESFWEIVALKVTCEYRFIMLAAVIPPTQLLGDLPFRIESESLKEMNERVGVISYGAGNLGSMINMIRHVGGDPIVISNARDVRLAPRLILPGVGHFDNGMQQLKERGFCEALTRWAAQERPLLGVCLGMQLFFTRSEEGHEPGLGLIPGQVCRLTSSTPALKIPHMGWNAVEPMGSAGALNRQADGSRYYFVHSFHAVPEDRDHWAGITNYGRAFCAAVDNGRGLVGYQFHPEKSHRFGMALVRSFVEA